MIYTTFYQDSLWGHAGTAVLPEPTAHVDNQPCGAHDQTDICPFCGGRHFEICQAELRQLLGRI